MGFCSYIIVAFEKWQAWAEEKACCDFAFKMKIPTPLNEELEDQIRELSMENNINCFLASMETFNDADLIQFYQACASSGKQALILIRPLMKVRISFLTLIS